MQRVNSAWRIGKRQGRTRRARRRVALAGGSRPARLLQVRQARVQGQAEHQLRARPPANAEPGIKAAVRREYQSGDVICKAGDVRIDGVPDPRRARATARASASAPTARADRRAHARLAGAPRRSVRAPQPGRGARRRDGRRAFGEVSPYASLSADRRRRRRRSGPGDFFGIDTCINFYPREVDRARRGARASSSRCCARCSTPSATRATRAARVDEAYAPARCATSWRLAPWLRGVGEAPREQLAAGAVLLTSDSDEIRDGVIYREGDAGRRGLPGARRHDQARPAARRTASSSSPTSVAAPPSGSSRCWSTVQPAPLRAACARRIRRSAAIELGGPLTIGRSASCDLRLPPDDRTIGKRHCRFEERDGEVFLDRPRQRQLHAAQRRAHPRGDRRRRRPRSRSSTTPSSSTRAGGRRDDGRPAAAAPARRPRASTTSRSSSSTAASCAISPPRTPRLRAALAGGGALDRMRPCRRAVAPDPSVLRELVDLNLYNSQNTLLIDLERCTRCDECVRACADAHGGVDPLHPRRAALRQVPGHDGVPLVHRSEVHDRLPGRLDPPRRTRCEIRIEPWCIGCQRCANQCPFGNINMVELAARGCRGSACRRRRCAPPSATSAPATTGRTASTPARTTPPSASTRPAFLSGGDLR